MENPLKIFKNFSSKTPEEKAKIKKAVIIYIIVVVFGIGGLLFFQTNQAKEKINEKEQGNNIVGSHLKGDTTSIATDKNIIYANSKKDSLNNSTDVIISSAAAGGVDPNMSSGSMGGGSSSDAQNSNSAINNYMNARQRSIQTMQNSSSDYSQYNNAVGGGDNRRSYNPNGNSKDWTSVKTSGIAVINSSSQERYSQILGNTDNKVTQNSSVPSSEIIKESNSNKLSLEQRRILLQTGKRDQSNTQSIKAAIDGNQSVRNGQTVRLKLMQEAFINKKFVRSLQTIFATVNFGENRLLMNVRSININGEIIACNLTVYATDGQAGLPVDLSSISSANDAINQEVQRGIGSSRVGQVISSLFRGSNRNALKIKVLNNHEIILVQNP